MSIRLVNQGDSGVKGGRAGHLYIKLSVPPDEVFKREGPNVHTDIPITVGQAILGGTVMVPTLAGQDLEIKVTLPILSGLYSYDICPSNRYHRAHNPTKSECCAAKAFLQYHLMAGALEQEIIISTSRLRFQRTRIFPSIPFYAQSRCLTFYNLGLLHRAKRKP